MTTSSDQSVSESESFFTPTVAFRISLLLIVASMSVVTAKLVDAPPLRSANDRSRWCTVWSLVERNTYQIDEIRQRPGWDTIDLVRHRDHFYSSKPPLLPRLVAEVYRVVRGITGWTLIEQTAETTRLILFLVNIVPMGIALAVFSYTVGLYARDGWTHLWVMTCACWGMLLLPYLTVFNNHTIAATAFFLALPMAIRILVEDGRSGLRYFACGLLTAFGVCNELPAALLGLVLFFLLLHHCPRRTLLCFAPGACLPIAAFLLTNYRVTGSLLPFYSKYGTATYEFVYQGIPSYWMSPHGIDLPRDSTLTYLFHCTLGHHGLLSLSPIFLLTLATWCVPSLVMRNRLKTFHWLGLGLTITTLVFYLTKTANYNYGGVSVGLRWMLWLTPFWLLSMLPIVGVFSRRLWFRGFTLLLLAVSVFSAWYPANSPWTQNWLFSWMERSGWIDYSDPRPQFQHRHYTWLGRLPSGPLQPDYFITFHSVSAEGRREKLGLRDGGPVNEGERLVIVSRVSDADPQTREEGYVLDVEKFRSSQPVAEFLLRRRNGDPVTEEDLTFFRGMPRRMQYLCSRIRYEKTKLREDAFRCQVGYTYVTIDGEDGSSRRVIRDIWLSEEVPFGILKWEERTDDGHSKESLARRVWRPVAAGRFFQRTKQPEF